MRQIMLQDHIMVTKMWQFTSIENESTSMSLLRKIDLAFIRIQNNIFTECVESSETKKQVLT
jgi:hypothetical protein